MLAGAACLAVEGVRRRTRPGPERWRSWSATERGRALAWLLCTAWVALFYVSTIGYIASGGGVHGRYLLPGLPAAALLAAAALGALPGRRIALAPAVVVLIMAGTGLVWAARFADRLRPDASWWGSALTAIAASANGVPAVAVWAAVALTLAGTAATAVALPRLARVEAPSADD